MGRLRRAEAPVRVEGQPTKTSGKRAAAFVYAFAGLYAGVYFAGATADYLFDLAPRADLGNMIQVVWSTAHGQVLRMSDSSGRDMSRLGAHADPFLILLAPLWWLYGSPIVLLGAQAFAVASGALPVYWLARKHLEDATAVVFPVAYLLFVPTQYNAFNPFGVHAVSFAIPLILFAIWFLDEDQLIAFAVFAILAVTTKEEIGAAVGALGCWYAVRRRRPYVGAAIFAFGAGVSLVNFLVVIPHFSTTGQSPFTQRYAKVGGTPTGMLHVAFTHPDALIDQLATWHNLLFLILMLGPFLGLWAFEPILLLGAVPDLAVNLLSSRASQSTIFGHYTAGITPFVVAASVLGAAKLRQRRVVGPALIGTACLLATLGPFIYLTRLETPGHGRQVEAMRQAVRIIPPTAPVSATRSLGGDVSERRTVALFPMVSRADWVLVGPATGFDNIGAFERRLAEIRASQSWTKVFDRSGIELFRRTAASGPSERSQRAPAGGSIFRVRRLGRGSVIAF